MIKKPNVKQYYCVVQATDTVIATTSFLMLTLANHPEVQVNTN